MKIKIVDSICGSGKTSAIIEMIKNDTSNNKYIYITPFLTEVKRIKDSCKNKHFCEPKYTGKGNKSSNFNNLILKGKNIVSTHALFQKATQDTIALIKSNNYILILDEVFNVVEQLNISKDDINLLFEQKMIKEENGYILWLDDSYNGEFNENFDISNFISNNPNYNDSVLPNKLFYVDISWKYNSQERHAYRWMLITGLYNLSYYGNSEYPTIKDYNSFLDCYYTLDDTNYIYNTKA